MQEKGYQFATICSSNVNRSMEAHSLFKKNHLRVCSYGTGRKIKIPGLSEKKPLEYGFGTEYETILNDLIELNKDFFTEREIIPMIQRDKGVKKAPQRFQDEFDLSFIDVCICFDEHVFDSVVEELQFRGCSKIKPIFVFNIHVKDRVSTAREGAKHALRLAEMLNACPDLEVGAAEVKKKFEIETEIPLLFLASNNSPGMFFMQQLIRQCKEKLSSLGFDLFVPFSVQHYNSLVQKRFQVTDFGRENTLAILIGNTRNLWTLFIRHLCEIDYQCDQDPNPLDSYTKSCVTSSFQIFTADHDIHYTWEMTRGRILPFQRISEICGLCENSKLSHLTYHPEYSSWIGLRAVAILNADFEDAKEFALPPVQPCICRECDEKAKVMLDELMHTTNYMELYKNDEVWRRWLSLRTICEKQPYVYSWPQAAYHYSKNQKYLVAEKERMRKGTFELDYDWVSDFNKDILGYKREIYCVCFLMTHKTRRKSREFATNI